METENETKRPTLTDYINMGAEERAKVIHDPELTTEELFMLWDELSEMLSRSMSKEFKKLGVTNNDLI